MFEWLRKAAKAVGLGGLGEAVEVGVTAGVKAYRELFLAPHVALVIARLEEEIAGLPPEHRVPAEAALEAFRARLMENFLNVPGDPNPNTPEVIVHEPQAK